MLPTISACTFMYRRLCHDFRNLNVKVSTSTMEEERFVKDGLTRINIITCDPFMVDYMREFVTNNNWTHQDLDYDNQGRVNDETTNFDQFLKHQWCTKKVYNDYDLTDFYDSLKHTTWEADPKMYLINWVLYTKNFIPIKSAIDLDSKTYIINWIVYYNY